MLGAFIITQLPAINNIIGGSSEMITMMLVLFSVGVGIGSLLCNKLLDEQIDSRFAPFCLLGMSIVMFNMSHAISKLHSYAYGLKLTFYQFASIWLSWRLGIDILLFSILGGIFIVPLYTILQHETKDYLRARMIAYYKLYFYAFRLISNYAFE